ncbi:MAG: DoxX family membrane protein [Chlorobiales bacterium]|nr:DoxX family membrane protein [Chlorobiales bacterium]
MKSVESADYLSLLGRIVLGLFFIIASIEKLASPNVFAHAFENYRIVGAPYSTLVSTVLPWIELLSGLGILLGIFTRGSLFLVSGLLTIFIAATLSALLRGLDISCGCFSLAPDAHQLGWEKIWENFGLLSLSSLLYYFGSFKLSLENYLLHPASHTQEAKS